MKLKTLLIPVVLSALFLTATSAQAIPAFARKYQTDCSSCHTAFPQLNAAGRAFKEDGYRFPKLKGEKTISDFLHMDKYFPASALLNSRPYDKKDSGDTKNRALHEVEILVAGVLYKNVSGFFELEAEDEDTNARGFEVGIPHAVFTYNHSPGVNLDFAWAGLLADDPYDTYQARRLTRGTMAVADQRYGGADDGGKFGDSRQTISVHGRPMKQLYYSVGVSGLADDSEGVNPNVLHGRVAFDITDDIMVGGLIVDGTCKDNACPVDRDFDRVGLDFQADVSDFRVLAAYMQAEDENAAGSSSVDNDAWYVEGQYFMKDGGRPTFVPLIRFDNYEKNDGADDYSSVTLNLSYYFTQNIRGYVEYWDQYDTPSGVDGDSRLTLSVIGSF